MLLRMRFEAPHGEEAQGAVSNHEARIGEYI
jgi:hypothetical protein